MKLIKRANGYWYCYFDRSTHKSLKTKDEKRAKELFEEIKRKDRDSKIIQLDKVKKIRLSEFRDEYLPMRELQDLAEGTVENDKRGFNKMIEIAGDLPLRLLDRKQIDNFKHRFLMLGKQKTYINTLLRALRTAFNYAFDAGYINANPFMRMRNKPPVLFRIDETLPRFLHMNEIAALFKVINDPDFVFAISLYLYCGLRRSELIRLTVQDLDIDNGFIYVRQTKSKKDRAVPINDELRKVIQERSLPDIGRLFPRWTSADTLSRLFHIYTVKAGIKARLHDLRHTFGSYLAMSGVDLKRIKDLMGHSDIHTTEIYAKLTKEHLVEAVNKLNFSIGQNS